MVSKQRQLARARATIRPGEGVEVDVIRSPKDESGRADEIGLDLTSAPVPARSYYAEVAATDYANESVRLMFGQQRITGPTLRSLLVVSLSTEAAQKFLATCSDFRPKLDQYLADARLVRATPFTVTDEPAQSVALVANIVTVAHSSREACLDFYSLSPRMLVDFARSGLDRLAIDPVVRVMLRTTLLATVIDGIDNACRAVTGEIDHGRTAEI